MKSSSTIRRVFGLLGLLAGVVGATRPVAALPAPPEFAPVLNEKSPKAIPGQYIAFFNH